MDMGVDEKAGLLHRQGCEAACWRINVLLFDKRFDELLLPVASRARRLFRRCHVDESAKRAGGGERILWQWRAAQAYRHRSCLWLPAGQFVRQQGQGQSLRHGLACRSQACPAARAGSGTCDLIAPTSGAGDI